MLFSRAYFALLRRNLIYRKRNLIGALLEILLPVGFICILLWIKVAVEGSDQFQPLTIPPFYPDVTSTVIPLSFQDYVSSLRATRTCEPSLYTNQWTYQISGYEGSQNPFLKCDRRYCASDGENATLKYCEHLILALAPQNGGSGRGMSRAEAFQDYINDRYMTELFNRLYQDDGNYPDGAFVKIFNSEQELDDYVQSALYGTSGYPKVGFAIVFPDGSGDNDYAYKLRLNSTNFNSPELEARATASTTPPTSRKFSTYSNIDDGCNPEAGSPETGPAQSSCTGQYLYNGAITMQRTLQDWIFQETGSFAGGMFVAEHGVQFVSFPTNEYTINGFYAQIAPYAPLLIVLGLLYPVAAILRSITLEKQLRQKELMKMMSVTDSDLGWSWFTFYFVFHVITAVCSALASDALYEQSAFGVLFLFWIMAYTAVITFASVLASLFTKATTATLIGMLVFFCGYFLTLVSNFQTGNGGLISLISLHPVAAISYGMQEIGRLEDLGVGATPSTITSTDSPSGYTLSSCLGSLFLDAVLWGVLSWYTNRVLSSQFGQPLPWSFPFTSSYWCPGRRAATNTGDEDTPTKDYEVPVEEVSEAVHTSIQEGKGIAIKSLSKHFGDKTAVDGLSMSMYPNQITALLGHNGAGKTTLINMLTGMNGPSSGYAVVAGKDIRTDMGQIRKEIGICLQHDCLFPQLTVQEHIQFFSRLKGLYSKYPKAEVEMKIKQSLEDVALLEKKDTLSKNLSGGMKRKLSVAIAFCGESKTVLLDEPTSGMDPFSRRFTWNVIRQYRQDRCIILTTHFMDEADILGDRICIMSEGRLCCAGSSLFLKKHYGVGYQLTIEKIAKVGFVNGSNGDGDGQSLMSADDKLKDIVLGTVSEGSLLSNVGTEMSFQLPIGASSQFKSVFEQLDQEVDSGSIVTYGVSITTLDEVFLLVARGALSGKVEHKASRADGALAVVADEESHRSRMDLDNNWLFPRHITSLFRKRALSFKRDKKAWVCSILLPSVLVMLGFVLFTLAAPRRNMPELVLSMESFNADISESPRNPIPFNAPGTDFTCQPGVCISGWGETTFDQPESYSFCGIGFSGGIVSSCSIGESESLVSQISAFDSEGVPLPSTNILESSINIKESAKTFAATQYGALQFTHDQFSQIQYQDGTSANYSSTVVQRCVDYVAGTQASFVNASYCDYYGGVGYVVNFNFTSLHSSLIYQAVADQALIREALANDVTISPTIHPLPLTDKEENLGQAQDAFIAWFLVVFSFPFISGTFATFVVAERSSKAKHLQTVAGVDPAAYWISSYLWDTLNYQVTCWITVILMFAFSVDSLTSSERGLASGSIVTLVLFGPASAGLTYCFTFLFKSPSLCNLFVIITNFLIGLAGPLVVLILRFIGDPSALDSPSLVQAAIVVEWVLRFVPSFNLGNALFKIINIIALEAIFGKPITVWSPEAILYETIFQAAEGVVYIILAIFIDKWSTNPNIVGHWQSFIRIIFCRFSSRKSSRGVEYAIADDSDVVAENERVGAGDANSDLIVLDKLSKVYDNGKVAVNNLSLGIPPGQCFGLLGINGAGKTTTMGMLTAEFPPSAGDATLAGFSVSHEPQKTRRRVGYCPQFDAHFANLTGREHVQLYAAIKGVPREAVEEAVTQKLSEIGLSEADSDRLCAGYSGGMKRKLSVACATIGQPQMVFLDEPSTGMDPVARRDLWSVISEMVTGGDMPDEERPSVILTTHSMEECEALCPRIGIMANGKLSCLGSAQHLKSRFGQGFQVELKTKIVDTSDEDYQEIRMKISDCCGKVVREDPEDGVGVEAFLNLDEVMSTLKSLTGDDSLSAKIDAADPTGFGIFKSASSPVGCSIDELASFVTSESRMMNLDKFFSDNFAAYALRERQDSKARYEVSSSGTRISEIFAKIEANKESLVLSDYGVSQTSLEQVFNIHAAEAEKLKHGQNDG